MENVKKQMFLKEKSKSLQTPENKERKSSAGEKVVRCTDYLLSEISSKMKHFKNEITENARRWHGKNIQET